MKKTKIIKEIVGERLKEHGFAFLKTEGVYWKFVREAHGFKRYYDPETDVVKQYVTIQENRFAKGLTVRFSTDLRNGYINGDVTSIKWRLSQVYCEVEDKSKVYCVKWTFKKNGAGCK